jgi:hypothetical protein
MTGTFDALAEASFPANCEEFPVFSRLSGNFGLETGSIWTASASQRCYFLPTLAHSFAIFASATTSVHVANPFQRNML